MHTSHIHTYVRITSKHVCTGALSTGLLVCPKVLAGFVGRVVICRGASGFCNPRLRCVAFWVARYPQIMSNHLISHLRVTITSWRCALWEAMQTTGEEGTTKMLPRSTHAHTILRYCCVVWCRLMWIYERSCSNGMISRHVVQQYSMVQQ